MSGRNQIRPASVAGLFYPGDKLMLERDLSLLLENSPHLTLSRQIRGMVVPHAGYMYSGGVSARAYRQIIQLKYDVIILIGVSHDETFDFVSIYPGKGFATPIGDVLVDHKLVEELIVAHTDIRFSEKGYMLGEHTLEVQMPFLKWVQDSTKIVPLMMGNKRIETVQMLRDTLKHILEGQNFLVIASTDLSHFHTDAEARLLDQAAMDDIKRFSSDRLFQDIENERCEMCGYGAVIAAMELCAYFMAKEAKVLLYRNSGDITGQRDNVVGYLSAIFY